MKGFLAVETILVVGIIFLVIHHYYKHQRFIDGHDFVESSVNLFDSHEGLIMLLGLLLVGSMIGGLAIGVR